MREDRIPRAALEFTEGALGKYDTVAIFNCLPDDVRIVRGGADFQLGTSALILESREFPSVTMGMMLPRIDIVLGYIEADDEVTATWSIKGDDGSG